MTKLTSSILLAVFCMTAFGQSIDKDNLEKYWQYRDRFRQKFSKIGAAPGESLPIKAWQNAEDNLSGMPLGSTIRLWDEMIEHGYYLMVLAMEYELLSRAGKDRTAVKNELYYALNAVNRVDYEAERYLSANNQNPSLNGFFLRDDVPPSFIENFQEEGLYYMDTDYSNPKLMDEYVTGSAHPLKPYVASDGSYDD